MKLLYDTTTSALVAYPRDDDGPVVGLDPRYLELTVVQELQPSYDPATEQITPTEAIDLNALVVTRGWDVSPLPAPVLVPDWPTFKAQAIESAGLNAILADALVEVPVAASALASAVLRAEQGDISDFRASWLAICSAVPAAAAAAPGFQQVATACNLPAAFVAALEPET